MNILHDFKTQIKSDLQGYLAGVIRGDRITRGNIREAAKESAQHFYEKKEIPSGHPEHKDMQDYCNYCDNISNFYFYGEFAMLKERGEYFCVITGERDKLTEVYHEKVTLMGAFYIAVYRFENVYDIGPDCDWSLNLIHFIKA